jgi:hypothetical protein
VPRKGFSSEGLFPDEWIMELHELHPAWFMNYSVDAEQNLLPFSLADNHKRQFLDWMLQKAQAQMDLTWASRWLTACGVIEAGLKAEGIRLYGGEIGLAAMLRPVEAE